MSIPLILTRDSSECSRQSSEMKTRNLQFPMRFHVKCCVLAMLVGFTALSRGAIPPAEQILPSDTLLLISAPDCTKAAQLFAQSPQSRLLSDPAMKPFRDKFVAKCKAQFLDPLERELGIQFTNFSGLARGQFTLAITQEGWTGQNDDEPALLVLLDTKDRSDQLKTNIANLRRKWVDAGNTLRTEQIRGLDFLVLPLSSNTVPKTVQQFFPRSQPIQELGKEDDDNSDKKSEIFVGQYESLLIVGDSAHAVEKVVARLTGGSVPALADEAAYQADHLTILRDAPFYGWLNAKRLFDVLLKIPEEPDNPQAPSPLPRFSINKIPTATGLAGLKTVAFASRYQAGGSTTELYIGVPESARQGLFKLLAAEAKDSAPPPFVPATVMKFDRWRIDGQKAVATLEKMIGEISPQALNFWNYIIKTGNEAAQQKDPDFDLRKNLFGNLGDDFINYTKPPRSNTSADLKAPPSILLLGSPNADKLAVALNSFMALISPLSAPKEREFLGRKIYSVNLPMRAVRVGTNIITPTLSYAASGGYVGLSTDVSLLEEYLRSSDTQAKPLRELAGLTEAAQKVGGQNTGVFSYENDAEQMRVQFKLLRNGTNTNATRSSTSDLSLLTSGLPFIGPQKSFEDWVDFSLLPEFDKVSKYFYFSVYAFDTSANGITFKVFSPTPPGLQ